MAKDAESRWLAGLAFVLLWTDLAASFAQELPSGGGAIRELRRGANGQIEVVPPDATARPGGARRTAPPAAVPPNLSSPTPNRSGVPPPVRVGASPPLPAGPLRPVITIRPNVPKVPDIAPGGTVVASYSVRMSDNSPFTGAVRFGPPYYDNNGKFALSGNNIIVNPNGPGIGPNKTTVTDRITLEAIPDSHD